MKQSAHSRRNQDILTIQGALATLRLGGLREPEICAVTGLSEDRVYRACKYALERELLVRRAEDGEMRLLTVQEQDDRDYRACQRASIEKAGLAFELVGAA